MPRIVNVLLVLLIILPGTSLSETYLSWLDKYNPIWTSQSQNSSESMPVGGGDIGLNVWVEDGDLLFYLSRSGTFDENNQFLKLGRVRLQLEPNPFVDGANFKQELCLAHGDLFIQAAHEDHQVQIKLWVDVFAPVVHLDVQSNKPTSTTATYETWRTADRVIPYGMRHGCFSYTGYPHEVVTYKDQIDFQKNTVQWVHRNRDDKLLFDFMVKQQHLESVKDQLWNPQKGLTFGGKLGGGGMVAAGTVTGVYGQTAFTGWQLKSAQPVKQQSLAVVLHVDQTETLEAWQVGLNKLMNTANLVVTQAQAKSQAWWQQFWERSWLQTSPRSEDVADKRWQVGRNYHLFRYMLGCNAYGDYPSKFNGSLFTFDPCYTYPQRKDTSQQPPDFRHWGGGSFTAQNQRLIYWPMLKNGDYDMMPSQFEYYRRPLRNAELRSEVYWNHKGCCFTEQLENFGLPFAGGWGFFDTENKGRLRPRDLEIGLQMNRHVGRLYMNQLEFVLMILDYYQFSGCDIQPYLPFIESAVVFFDEHYQFRNKQRTGQVLDDEGKLVLYPSICCETYGNAKNPSDLIAALIAVLTRLQALPDELMSLAKKAQWSAMLKRVPDVPLIEHKGHQVIAPAVSYGPKQNSEMPEMYTVYPYGLYGLGKPNLKLALDTYEHGVSTVNKKFTVCWSQVGIFAARLGLVDQAEHLVIDKLADAPRRFPAYWGPGPDYVPDVDHGGAGMINLQEMLMQTDGKVIRLFPTWPKDWDVDFKLHAPYQTVVNCSLRDGKIQQLDVTPASRKSDIENWLDKREAK